MQYASMLSTSDTPDLWAKAVVQKCYEMLCLSSIKQFIIAIHLTGTIIKWNRDVWLLNIPI